MKKENRLLNLYEIAKAMGTVRGKVIDAPQRSERCALCGGDLDPSTVLCSPLGELCYDCWTERYDRRGQRR